MLQQLKLFENRSEILGNVRLVALEKDGENQLNRLCEKWRKFQEERNGLHILNNRNVNWICYVLRRNYLIKHFIELNIEGRTSGTERQEIPYKQLLDGFNP